jgi:hypothetical protein
LTATASTKSKAAGIPRYSPAVEQREGMITRVIAITVFVLLNSFATDNAAWARSSNSCKQCSDEQKTCQANYSAATCKSQYDLCMKSCGKK